MLEATVRHFGDNRNVRVNPDRTEVELLREAHGATVVLGPHRRRKSVLDTVGARECFCFILELLHRNDGSEDLVLNHPVVLLESRNNRGLDEEAFRTLALSTGFDGRVVREVSKDSHDAIKLVDVVDGSEQDVLVGGNTRRDVSGDVFAHCCNKVVVNGFVHHHAGCRGAVLTGVEESCRCDSLNRPSDVSVVPDDNGRLATELEVNALDVIGRGLGNFHTRSNGPGDRHHLRNLVFRHERTGCAVSDDDVQDAGGKELGGHFSQQEC